MIPEFPQFKSLELSDKKDVEKFTSQFPPYSDFNFVSMWCWDIQGAMRISQLNNNLVVRFTDYLTGEPFFSFLGNNMVNETVETLLEFSKKEGLNAQLKLVPEDSISNLDKNRFTIEEDPNHFDYMISVSTLKEYDTPETKSRKKEVKSFLSKFNPEVKILNLFDSTTRKDILQLLTERLKYNENTLENELLAISRLMTVHEELVFLPVGIFIDSKLVGYFFSEILGNKFTTAHFWKANIAISQHIYAYLMQETAKILHTHGCELMNIEQDLGIENLRKWKKSYNSKIFLKKYIVKPS